MFKNKILENVLIKLIRITSLHPELSFDFRDLKCVDSPEILKNQDIQEISVFFPCGDITYFLGDGYYEARKVSSHESATSSYLLFKTSTNNSFELPFGVEDREIDPIPQGYILFPLLDKKDNFKNLNFNKELLQELRDYFFKSSNKYYQSIAFNILCLWKNLDPGAFSFFSNDERNFFTHPISGFKYLSRQKDLPREISEFFDRQYLDLKDSYCFYQIYFANEKWFIFSHSPLTCSLYRIDEETMKINYLSHTHRLCEFNAEDFFRTQILHDLEGLFSPVGDKFDPIVLYNQFGRYRAKL